MRSTLLFVVVFLTTQVAFSQKEKPKNDFLNYGDSVSLAYEKFEKQDYKGALDIYLRVPDGDTNFTTAAVEIIYTYYADKQYDKCVTYGEDILAKRYSMPEAFYLNLGSAYDELKEYQKAHDLYQVALKKFPMNETIYYNIGYSNEKLGNFQKAFESYKTAIEINPLYAKPHLKMAIMAINQGKTAQAIMAMNFYLLLKPNADNSNSVLSYLNTVCSSKYDQETDFQSVDISKGEDYSEIDLLISNYLALDKKYKVKSEIQLPFIKQSHLVLTKLAEMPASEDFWYRMYAPTFLAILKQNQFELYSYYIALSSGNEQHQKIIKSNYSKLLEFEKWAFNELDESHRKFYLPFPKSKSKDINVYRANKGYSVSLIAHVNEQNQEIQGYSERYYDDGSLQSTGFYNDEGQIEGEKLIFYPDGRLKDRTYYKKGMIQDSSIVYTKLGIIESFYPVKDEKIDGPIIHYDISGAISSTIPFKNEKVEGVKRAYYSNGKLSYELPYVNGLAHGIYKSYDYFGNLEEVAVYKDDKLNGSDTIFYPNGKIKISQTFLDGAREGVYTKYFEDGTLNERSNFKKGVVVGLLEEYRPDKTLAVKKEFDTDGNLTGIYTEYYRTGEKFVEYDYKNGNITAYRFFDKQGKIIGEGKRKFSNFDFVGLHENGQINAKGIYGNKLHQGKWEFYNKNGILISEKNFNEGNYEGKTTTYHNNGAVKSKEFYKDDKDWGLYEKFNASGILIKSGYFLDGQGVGSWSEYFDNGTLKEKYFAEDNKRNGFTHTYAPDGKIHSLYRYETGLITEQYFYNPQGEITDSIYFKNGSGQVVRHGGSKNSILYQYAIVNNHMEGEYVAYNSNEKVEIKGQYYMGEREGLWSYYFTNGKLKTQGEYHNGKKQGVWKAFHENGQLKTEQTFVKGLNEGAYKAYYDNGKMEFERIYKNDEIDGEAKYYSYDGMYDHSRYYDEGWLMSYSYQAEKGVHKQKIEKETGTINTYFKNGNPARKFTIENGWLQKELIRYYSNGKVYQKMVMLNDNYHGESKEYYIDGKIKIESNYAYDALEGVKTTYFPNGTIKSTETFLQGFLHGPSKFYDQNGNLTNHFEYNYNDMLDQVK